MNKKLLVINGTYRKGKSIDTLLEHVINGTEKNNNLDIEHIHLINKNIEYCKNCMVCRNEKTDNNIAHCIINDDMQEIYKKIEEADYYVFASPINMGTATAVMKTFLERTCWIFAQPGTKPVDGCPMPRLKAKKRAVILLTSGVIIPLFRRWCDDATSLIKSFCQYALNTKVVDSLYAGAVEKRGVSRYFKPAYKLGTKLVS